MAMQRWVARGGGGGGDFVLNRQTFVIDPMVFYCWPAVFNASFTTKTEMDQRLVFAGEGLHASHVTCESTLP